MKILVNVFLIVFFFPSWDSINSSTNQNLKDVSQKIFLEKTILVTDPRVYGQHIKIVQSQQKTEGYGFEPRIDDREILYSMHLDKSQMIQVLTQYLTFENDTIKSNKYFYFRTHSYGGHWEIPKARNFTIQIEALFSFTRMLTKDVPPLFPVLIERKTGSEINGDPQKIRQVFEIYRKWLGKNQKSQFKKITLPLDRTPYMWQGEDLNIRSFIKSAFP